jgi:membrane-bound inhibitor of C-type lysozyme
MRLIILYPLILTAAISACADIDTSDTKVDRTGADQDIHGCITTAGYAWCKRTSSCERPWELAKRRGIPSAEYEFNAYCSETPTQEGPVRYNCERGDSIEVQFSGTGEATLYRGDAATELSQVPTASGYYYTNGRIGIRGKGDEVVLEIGRMAPIQCQVEKQ